MYLLFLERGCLYWLFYAYPIIVCCLCAEHTICLWILRSSVRKKLYSKWSAQVQELKSFSCSWTRFTWDLELWWTDIAMVGGLGALEGRHCYIFCVREKWTLLVRRQTDCTISPLYMLFLQCVLTSFPSH